MGAAASPGGAVEALPGLALSARAGQALRGCPPKPHVPAAHQHLRSSSNCLGWASMSYHAPDACCSP